MQATNNERYYKYEFMKRHIIYVQVYGGVSICNLIEELSSPEALEHICTISICMETVANSNELFEVLKVFASKSNKVTEIILKQSGLDNSHIIDLLRMFEYVPTVRLMSKKCDYSPNVICMLKDYFDSATKIKSVRLEVHHQIIFDLADSIASNKYIDSIYLEVVYTIHDMPVEGVTRLANLIANSAATEVYFECGVDGSSINGKTYSQYFTEMFKYNYALTDFFALLDNRGAELEVKVPEITSRNKNIFHESRFAKTKPVQ